LRAQRFAVGSLNLDFPEVKVRLDKHGRPTHIEKIHYDISHQLIEEFMLVANEAVARYICNRQAPGIYRIHEDPDLEKLKDFREYAQSFGYKVGDVTQRRELQKLLAAVIDKPEEYAINLALLRSLKQARYSTDPAGHFGLAKKYYTHFTSPIRRYADLLVHRTLRGLIEKTNHRPSVAELAKAAEHTSKTERVAGDAEHESVELKKIEYFQQQLSTGKLDAMEAVVSGVRNFGFFVELTESLVRGLVHVSALEDDFFHYDEARERLIGKRSKRIVQIGDRLKVQVQRVDVFKRQIDFRVFQWRP
jgi:ribonuclease R